MKCSWKCIAAAALLAAGCVKTDPQLGRDLIDSGLLYDTYTVEFPLTEVESRHSEDLSAYSSTRVTLGAIRDDVFGLTTRSSAMTLIPALDTLDFGTNPKAVKFLFHLSCDTVSVADRGEANILQNVYVHELTDSLKTVGAGTRDLPSYSSARITRGTPVINGRDSLSFEFTKEFAQKYIDGIRALCVKDSILIDRESQSEDGLDSYLKERMKAYVEKLPGIFIETDVPSGNGGRITLFDLSCLSVSDNYYARNSNVAMLTMHSTWKGVEKDSTFLFIPGEPSFFDESEYILDNKRFFQYAFNYTGHETAPGKATTTWAIEGGGGLKPVVTAAELKEKTLAEILKRGSADKVIINKATILMPFEMPDDYRELSLLPSQLSPTIRTSSTGTVQFAGLTDASDATEDQGDIDLSNLQYSPDVSYHLQEILKRTEKLEEADIWLLIVHNETIQNATGSIYDNEYYQQLMYASYYNSIYGYDGYGYGGYGGYGYGYGGYGYGGYNNYYNYMMMAQMMAAQNQNSTTTTSEMDKDRYYRGLLNGPDATSVDPLTKLKRVPRFRVTFSIPKK